MSQRRTTSTYLTVLSKSVVLVFVAVMVIGAGLIGYARLNNLLLLSVQSGSMSPSIGSGDAVLVRQNHGPIGVGAVVTFRSPRNPKLLITHRVVSIDRISGMLTTKGDASRQADPPLALHQVVGTVEQVLPSVGQGLDFVRHPVGLVTALYVPCLGLIILEIRRLSRHYASRYYYHAVRYGRS